MGILGVETIAHIAQNAVAVHAGAVQRILNQEPNYMLKSNLRIGVSQSSRIVILSGPPH